MLPKYWVEELEMNKIAFNSSVPFFSEPKMKSLCNQTAHKMFLTFQNRRLDSRR